VTHRLSVQMSMGKVDSQLSPVRKAVVKCVTKYSVINVTDLEFLALTVHC
jgi:hypothetical protein